MAETPPYLLRQTYRLLSRLRNLFTFRFFSGHASKRRQALAADALQLLRVEKHPASQPHHANFLAWRDVLSQGPRRYAAEHPGGLLNRIKHHCTSFLTFLRPRPSIDSEVLECK